MRQREEIQEVLRKKRGLGPAGIVLFWLIMMSLLVYREVLVPRMKPGTVSRRFDQTQDLWMGVYVAGHERVGFLNTRSEPESRDGGKGLRLRLSARIVMPLFGRSTDLFLTGSAWFSETAGLTEFDVSFTSGEHALRAEGKVEGRVLRVQLHTAGETIPLTFPVGDDLLFSGGMGMNAFDVPLLEPGEESYMDSFDPATMKMGKAKVACIRKERRAIAGEELETYVMETTIGGLKTLAWVTPGEEVVRAETPFGFTLEKISPQDALAPVTPSEQASLIRTMAIRPSGMTPFRGATMLHVRFSGIPGEHMPPSDSVQTATDSGYIITTPNPSDTTGNMPLSEEERAASLASDGFISSDHPKIVAAALAAIGDEQDPWKQALRLHKWVYDSIAKNPVISVPTALDVLETREGDCNEHTVLYVALARAIGIPARIAIGIAWSEELQTFGYHAWPEVYVGQWIPTDPTFGEPVADATHIKLLNGGIDTWAKLLPYIGRLQIDVLEVR